VLRVIGYPPLPASFDTDTGISCGAHTDYGCLTFLLADPTPGALQVEAKDGSWIPADPVPGAFVVNIGDIIDTLTGHQYKSTYHRVIHRGEKYRVSIPFFFEPMRDMVIKPFAEMMAPGVKVEPFTYFDHLKASSNSILLRVRYCTRTVPRIRSGWTTVSETASRCLKLILVLYSGSSADRTQSMIYRHFVANDQSLPNRG
jgi:isopenicillin N synthase-like dioxygenase